MRIRVPSTLHCHLHRIDYLTYLFNMRGAIQSTNMMNYPTLIVGNNTVCYEAGFFRHHRCETTRRHETSYPYAAHDSFASYDRQHHKPLPPHRSC